MTTVMNMLNIVEHGTRGIDKELIEKEMLHIYRDTLNELSNISFSTDPDDESYFNSSVSRTSLELEKLETLAKGCDLKELIEYTEKLEEAISDLSSNLFCVAGQLSALRKDIEAEDYVFNKESVADSLYEAVSDSLSKFDGCRTITATMAERGWRDCHKRFLMAIYPQADQRYVDVLCEKSDGNNVIVGIHNAVNISHRCCELINGNRTLRLFLDSSAFKVYFFDGNKTNVFEPFEIKDYFTNILDPLPEEIDMYEMSSGKRYDISLWRDIFFSRIK